MNETVAVAFGLLLASAAVGPVVLAQEDDGGWPREIEAGGHRVIMDQPQLEAFTGDEIKGRAAVPVTLPGKSEPIFGTVWLKARTMTDRDTREVTLEAVSVPQVRFPNADPEQEKQLAALLEREIPTWGLTLSLDRLLAALELVETERVAAGGLNNDPPRIVMATAPTVLVSIDGQPKLQKIENTPFENVVNTAFVIIHDQSRTFYLSAGANTWYTARAALGPWAVAKSVPPAISGLLKEEEPADEADGGPTTPPAILVATEPTELDQTQLSRQRGAARTQSYNRSRSGGGTRPGGRGGRR